MISSSRYPAFRIASAFDLNVPSGVLTHATSGLKRSIPAWRTSSSRIQIIPESCGSIVPGRELPHPDRTISRWRLVPSFMSNPAPVTRIGTLSIDHRAREAAVAGRPVTLAAKEFELLRRLASEPTRVFTKRELLRDVWGYPAGERSRTADSHAARLRQKLAVAGAGRRLVITVWGVGWRLIDGDPHPPQGESR